VRPATLTFREPLITLRRKTGGKYPFPRNGDGVETSGELNIQERVSP
jgi:hypothetical protein